MILTLNSYDLDKTNIVLGNKETNLIGDYKFFYKLFYSTNYYVMNGICIKLNLVNYKQGVFYNYIKINYNLQNNINLINLLGEVEKNILSNVPSVIKNNLYNDLMCGVIKIQKKSIYPTRQLVLRITGVWETNDNCGITYKFAFV